MHHSVDDSQLQSWTKLLGQNANSADAYAKNRFPLAPFLNVVYAQVALLPFAKTVPSQHCKGVRGFVPLSFGQDCLIACTNA